MNRQERRAAEDKDGTLACKAKPVAPISAAQLTANRARTAN